MALQYAVCYCDECTHKRLVAAAPALLAALKAHLPWHTEPVQGWGVWADAVHAIEQAEGVTTEGTNGKKRSLD
jgi:hypothetical protein